MKKYKSVMPETLRQVIRPLYDDVDTDHGEDPTIPSMRVPRFDLPVSTRFWSWSTPLRIMAVTGAAGSLLLGLSVLAGSIWMLASSSLIMLAGNIQAMVRR